MTPSLRAVYDELLRLSSLPPLRDRAEAARESFLRRTGRPNGQDQERAEFAGRLHAAWDEALTRGGLARDLADTFEDPSERALARVLSRSHRGTFHLSEIEGRQTVRDLVTGAAFVLIARDDVGRALAMTEPNDLLFDGRVVAAADGAAILPGVVFHPPDATAAIETVITAGVARGLAADDVCDALLRMEFAFRTLSRVKIAYAYRTEALSSPAPPALAPNTVARAGQ